MADRSRLPYPGRLSMVIISIAIWSGFILFRLVQLQVFRHQQFEQLALQQQYMTRMTIAPRGVIYDSHMDELATSMPVNTVAAEPRNMQDKAAVAQSLASVLGMDAHELLEKLSDPRRQTFQIVKRRIDPQVGIQLEKLELEGVHLFEESMRVYPNRSLASHVLGFVNMNGDGQAGIEQKYDKELKGTQGVIRFNIDGRRRSFRGAVEKPAIQGRSLVISINKSIQFIVERELAAGVSSTKATRGTAIVMESDTGRILALANYPDFNCNTFNQAAEELLGNRAVSVIFEPGSTFKVVVATVALDAGLTRPEEVIDCQMGVITVGRHTFHDHKPYGLLTFNQVLEHSSNIGAVKLGLRLGAYRLHQALRRFGFGSKTGVDLPGEIMGLVRDVHAWSALSVAAISFGQEVGVTSMQMLVAINSIANGGYRVRPSIVDRVIGSNGDLIRVQVPERERIMKPETAAAVREAFEGVVLRGTGKRAALQGYRAAGKTGTAQKIVNGHYSSTQYVASFVGFAPLPQPRLTILVQIEDPEGSIYGGDVSAPIFQKIAQEALLQLGVPPDRTQPLPRFNPSLAKAGTEDYLPNASPVLPMVAASEIPLDGSSEEVIVMRVSESSVEVPDFHGMAKRKVIDRCHDLGIQVHPIGSGIAVYQIPPPGTRIPAGDICNVTFAQGMPAARLRVPGFGNGLLAQQDASTPNPTITGKP